MTEKTLMVVDCDAGIDDAQAIMMALAQPHIEVLAITCVVGNQHDVRQICRNVLRILKVCGKLDKIPVYKGAETTLLHRTNAIDSSHFHGVDGLGDKPDPEAPDDSHIDSKNGILALIDLVKNHPGEITVVALGPLTNLALAARVDSDFSKNIKEVSIMGGNTESKSI
ncbi:uncharacterized protein LOC100372874 [Saccoglossus kowalevskii]|uniref:Probable uridine nucleosidase 2-like n=1 Tax=Saccoglossus kowalevskii TaxID=10224 RepID=A0ABM0GQS0_SACKO|nr:PREDICTED: probable uridine nucleosidase 2-like [Saccoglossus kowalevskii]